MWVELMVLKRTMPQQRIYGTNLFKAIIHFLCKANIRFGFIKCFVIILLRNGSRV
jgi:hypothetical protein